MKERVEMSTHHKFSGWAEGAHFVVGQNGPEDSPVFALPGAEDVIVRADSAEKRLMGHTPAAAPGATTPE